MATNTSLSILSWRATADSEPDNAGRWWVATGLVALAAGLSAAQIYLRQSIAAEASSAAPPPFGSLMLGNLIAWAPWIALGSAIVRISRSLERSVRLRSALLLHLVIGHAVAGAYLIYLAVFRAWYLPAVAAPFLERGWSRLLLREASDFYLTTLLLYAAVAIWASLRNTRRSVDAEPSTKPPTPPVTEAPRIEVRSVSSTRWVPAADVDWIEAAGNYTRLHTRRGSVLHRQPLKELAAVLAEQGFERVHRSHAVRLARIETVRPLSHGDALITIVGGRELRVSRSHRPALLERMRRDGRSNSSHGGSSSSHAP